MHNLWSLLLPLIFIFHNAEEYAGFDEFGHIYEKRFGERFNNRIVFLYATIFLSAVVAVCIVANFFIVNTVLNWVSVILLLSIAFNAVVHILASIYKRRPLPGVYTAVVLILPYTALMAHFTAVGGLLKAHPVWLAVAAVVAMILFALISLFIGFFSHQIITQLRR